MRLEKKTRKLWHLKAENLEDWCGVVADRANEGEKVERWINTSHQRGGKEWSGTDSLEEAQKLLLGGWHAGLDKIEKAKAIDTTDHANSLPTLSPSYSYDVAGEFADVASFCAGEPEHMGSPVDGEHLHVSPVVEVYLNMSTPACIEAHEMENYGAALMSVLDAIQTGGRSTTIYWCFGGCTDNRTTVTTVPLSTAGAPLDRARLAFAFNPAMVRRCYFAVMEMFDDLKYLGGGRGPVIDEIPSELLPDGAITLAGPFEVYQKLRSSIPSAKRAREVLEKELHSKLFGDIAA